MDTLETNTEPSGEEPAMVDSSAEMPMELEQGQVAGKPAEPELGKTLWATGIKP